MKKLAVTIAAASAALAAALPLWGATSNAYTVHALVSDQPGAAATADPDLVNA